MDRPADFPLRETCDPTNPEEAFLWMLVALPMQRGAPLIMPVEYLRQISRRLWDCGARPVAEPVIKYRKPMSGDPHWLTAPGQWVPASEPDPEPNPAVQVWEQLTSEQQAAIRALVNKETP